MTSRFEQSAYLEKKNFFFNAIFSKLNIVEFRNDNFIAVRNK